MNGNNGIAQLLASSNPNGDSTSIHSSPAPSIINNSSNNNTKVLMPAHATSMNALQSLAFGNNNGGSNMNHPFLTTQSPTGQFAPNQQQQNGSHGFIGEVGGIPQNHGNLNGMAQNQQMRQPQQLQQQQQRGGVYMYQTPAGPMMQPQYPHQYPNGGGGGDFNPVMMHAQNVAGMMLPHRAVMNGGMPYPPYPGAMMGLPMDSGMNPGQMMHAGPPAMVQLVGADGLPYQGSYRDLQPKQFRHHRGGGPASVGKASHDQSHQQQHQHQQPQQQQHQSQKIEQHAVEGDHQDDDEHEGDNNQSAPAKRRSRGGRKRGQKQAFLNQDNSAAPAAPSFLRGGTTAAEGPSDTSPNGIAESIPSVDGQQQLPATTTTTPKSQDQSPNRSQNLLPAMDYHQYSMQLQQQRHLMSMTDSQTAMVGRNVVDSVLAGEEGEDNNMVVRTQSQVVRQLSSQRGGGMNQQKSSGSGINSGLSSKGNSGRQINSGRGNGNMSNPGNTSASDDLNGIVDDGRPLLPTRSVLKELAKACKPRPPWFVGMSNKATPTEQSKSKDSPKASPNATMTESNTTVASGKSVPTVPATINSLDDELHLFANFISPTAKESARLDKMKAACEECFGTIWTASAEAAAAEEALLQQEEGEAATAPQAMKKKKITLMPMGITAAGVRHPPGIAPSHYYAAGTQILYSDTEDEIRNVLLTNYGYTCEFFMDSARDCSTVLITDPHTGNGESNATAPKAAHHPNSSATTTPNPHAPAQIAVRYGPRATRCGPAATLLTTHIASDANKTSTMIVIDALLRQNNIIDAKGNDPTRVSSETVAVMFLSLVRAMAKGDFAANSVVPPSSSFSVSSNATAATAPAQAQPQPQAAVPSPSLSAAALQITAHTHPILAFFMYYGFPVNFDPTKYSVHPDGVLVIAEGADSSAPTRSKKVHPEAAISVLDPADLKRNLSSKVTNVTHIAAILHYCYTAISQHEQVPVAKRRAQSALSTIIGGEAYWGRILELSSQGVEPYHHVVSSKRKLLLRAMMEQ
eukprot:GILJ01017261.1.p1 GENE.GILJ01017261.1~~GILJ01017261.1.p1  ORF type:complete len:1063 (-),score=197.17 GILJ01017261.1:341-3418(-)